MKNLFFTLLIALFTGASAFAQTFNLSPDTVITIVTVDSMDISSHNDLTNLTNSSRSIRWERTIISVDPDTLLTQICDPNACYLPPVSTKIYTLAAGATVPMIVHLLNNSGGPASAIVQLKYTDLADPTNPQFSYYFFDAIVGTDEQLPAANVKLFPNPFVESFSLDNAGEVARIRVYGTDGRLVFNQIAQSDNVYSLAGQPAGTYLVALQSKSGKLFQAIKVVKK